MYVDTQAGKLYGPKASGVWPAWLSLVGPAGPPGTTGATGPSGAAGPTGPSGSGATFESSGQVTLDPTVIGPSAYLPLSGYLAAQPTPLPGGTAGTALEQVLPKAETFTGITLQLITLAPVLIGETVVTATLYDGFIPVFICPLVIPFLIPPACQFQPVAPGRPRLPLKTPATSVSPLAAGSLGRSSLPPRWASPPRNHHWFIRSAARHRTPKRLGRRPDPEPEQPSPEPHVDMSTIRRVAPPREAYTVRRIRRSLSHRHWDHRSGSWDRDEP